MVGEIEAHIPNLTAMTRRRLERPAGTEATFVDEDLQVKLTDRERGISVRA
jgi:hypothetical protein